MARKIKELTRKQLEDWGIQSVNFDGSEIIRQSIQGLVPIKPFLNNCHNMMCEWRYKGEHHYIPLVRLVYAWHYGKIHKNCKILAKEGFDINTTHAGQLQEVSCVPNWAAHCDVAVSRFRYEEDLERAKQMYEMAKIQGADKKTKEKFRNKVFYCQSKLRYYDMTRKRIVEEMNEETVNAMEKYFNK